MAPFPVTVRYRFGEGGESRDARFYGLFHARSEEAVLGRLREVHRFAAWVEVVEVWWRGGVAAGEGGGRGGRLSSSPGKRRECIPVHARDGCVRRARMDTMTTTREGGPSRERGDAGWRPRRHARCGMFKPAHVVLEDAVLDCVLLDLSPGGAQVYLIARAELPDRVTLWLPGGESRPVLRRWQRGSHVGFEAAGDAVPPS